MVVTEVKSGRFSLIILLSISECELFVLNKYFSALELNYDFQLIVFQIERMHYIVRP